MTLQPAGVVSRDPDPYIARPTWLVLIEAHELRPIESFTYYSVFTRQAARKGRPDCEPAAVVRGGKRVGVVVWHAEGKGLDLYGDPGAMAEVGAALAAGIGGTYEPDGP
jgi:hypothetical protein